MTLLRIDLAEGTVVDAVTMERVGVVTPTRDPDENHVQISVRLDPERDESEEPA